ncbi:hypothetical protein [Mycobacterium ostraviense]|uniref:Secreted protein n=1 Tax=Mycobacterium ostraviense TaxID=2738409 RepID=A0A163XY84_9MYCO|nr:hypothetical protein [Mycobacterium ostraviense]KZS59882.1 hypothetical protein A4G28_08855 [Mycobacterium ostraviense]UGT92116.1 hypothetical protein LTS72_01315 [Mycobacterium ostraviense]
MLTKVLIGAAIVLGAAVGVAAPAMADPAADPTDGIGSFALNCADATACPPDSLGNAPTANPQQLTQAIKNGFSGPSDFSDLHPSQGQQ